MANMFVSIVDLLKDMMWLVNTLIFLRKSIILSHILCIIESITITGICNKNNIQITLDNKNIICQVFEEIEKILPRVNCGRKRMISINFILRRLFKMMKIPRDGIKITKSKKTLAYYKEYWKNIKLLIGDKIKYIIHK